jgi:transposase-like protein
VSAGKRKSEFIDEEFKAAVIRLANLGVSTRVIAERKGVPQRKVQVILREATS